ncbi:MAG: hypothetical protein MZU95_13265 [Desulfomicrobium escambiense]|nr:hypothetical protein [Desulfomicrobium escambiense]
MTVPVDRGDARRPGRHRTRGRSSRPWPVSPPRSPACLRRLRRPPASSRPRKTRLGLRLDLGDLASRPGARRSLFLSDVPGPPGPQSGDRPRSRRRTARSSFRAFEAAVGAARRRPARRRGHGPDLEGGLGRGRALPFLRPHGVPGPASTPGPSWPSGQDRLKVALLQPPPPAPRSRRGRPRRTPSSGLFRTLHRGPGTVCRGGPYRLLAAGPESACRARTAAWGGRRSTRSVRPSTAAAAEGIPVTGPYSPRTPSS